MVSDSPALDPAALDLPVLTSLVGIAVDEELLRTLHTSGHPDIRASHGFIVQLLIDESPTVSELGERLGVTQQAASKSVLELERLGYVERRPDPGDSRIRRVALTDRGRDVLERSRRTRRDLELRVAKRVDAADLAATRRVLVALLDSVGGLEAVHGRRVRLPSS